MAVQMILFVLMLERGVDYKLSPGVWVLCSRYSPLTVNHSLLLSGTRAKPGAISSSYLTLSLTLLLDKVVFKSPPFQAVTSWVMHMCVISSQKMAEVTREVTKLKTWNRSSVETEPVWLSSSDSVWETQCDSVKGSWACWFCWDTALGNPTWSSFSVSYHWML